MLRKSSDRIIKTKQDAVRQMAGNTVTKNIVCDEGETLKTQEDDPQDLKYSDVQALKENATLFRFNKSQSENKLKGP